MSPEPPPDVALVSPYPRLGVRHGGSSGVASYTANLAHGLAAIGLHVTVVAPLEEGEPGVGRDGPVQVVRAFTPGRVDAVPRALAAARSTGADVVHLQHELFLYGGPGSVAGLVGALAAPSAVPTVVTMHQVVDPAAVDADFTRMHRIPAPPSVARTALRTVQRTVAGLADATIVHEPSFTKFVPGAYAVRHGIETVSTVDDGVRAQMRERLGLDPERLVALCFGFVAPYKGLETALDAAALAGGAVQLVVAGGEHPRLLAAGDDYAGSLRHRYRDTARFTGFVPDEDVAAWFIAADVALFPYPSPHAASGAFALALAHGTAALLSPRLAASAGASDALTVPLDPVALATELVALSEDRAKLRGLRAEAACLAHDRSWPATARAHQSIYHEVAHAPRSSRRRLRAA